MEVLVKGRHAELDDEVKEYAAEKLEGLSRYYKWIRTVEAVLNEDHLTKECELIAHLSRGAPLVVSAKHEQWLAAIDIAHDQLKRVLQKFKEKQEDRRQGKGHAHKAVAPDEPDSGPITEDFIPDLNS